MVLVFKTSVRKRKDIRLLKPIFKKLLPKEDLWNFDLEDCDKILRVETKTIPAALVLNTLHNLGYTCEILE